MKWKIILILLLLFPVVNAAGYRVWAEGPSLITVGRPVQIQVYTLKNTTGNDSYAITPLVTDARDDLGNQVPYLLSVSIPSNRINNLDLNDIGSTFATVVARGKINTATITFTVDPDIEAGTSTIAVQFKSGLPVSLPEFGFVGLIVIVIFSFICYTKVKLKY